MRPSARLAALLTAGALLVPLAACAPPTADAGSSASAGARVLVTTAEVPVLVR
ncbi:hypothetical protein SAMN06264364_12065 [Quadrisphaera granulorum]|uniref:Uncharacterized protein n=1 Tax=Quadrisphaera granulorum TaxID=317664 RepID=A0A316ANX7_9ACTN|nr:hypothetical protein [Quadrisphaera granulorum]PWJ51787.1 hypothetical protein BXY45_12065 [Quadrisphaera granulorum]SZE97734.1 hypothetical protein SAMN06264364_12065 [Quadrisphaera granulorum]